MALNFKTLRQQLFLTTAASALVAMSSAANAQLVRSGDLNSARNSSGNPGQLTVTDTSATQTDMRVESKVVVADWTSFNVPTGTTVNVTAGGTLTTATLLNRVIGANFSDISGTINAAAINFWLINQNGILFGDGASINAASFFASTLNVSDQDFFDFYEGTDLAGNGSGTINFGSGFGTSIVGGGANATFITDGSLVFVSDGINLTGAFDAQSGRAAFIAAKDVDVTFTPGSPLSYTVNAGSTVASALTVGGSIEGQAVEFAMFTATGVTGALLQVDADVTANAASATDTGIALRAEGLGVSTADTLINGTFTSKGRVNLLGDGELLANADITGSFIDLDFGNALQTRNLASTVGDIQLDASGAITTGDVSAATFASINSTGGSLTTGNVVTNGPGSSLSLRAGGAASDITTGTLNSNSGDMLASAGRNITTGDIATALAGAPTAASIGLHAGGSITAGQIDAGEDLRADAPGAFTASGITAGDDVLLNIGGHASVGDIVTDGDGSDLFTFDFSGPAGASSLLFALETTPGSDIVINSGSADLGALSAADDVTVRASGAITLDSALADNDASGAGNLSVRSSTSSVDILGHAQGAVVSLRAAGALTTDTVSATGGNAFLNGASVTASGLIDATNNVSVQSRGAVNLAAVTADSDSDLVGDVLIGTTLAPSIVRLNGPVSGAAIEIHSAGAIIADGAGVNFTTSVGGASLTAADDIIVRSSGAITLGSAIADSDGDLTGNLVVRSSGSTVDILGHAKGVAVTLRAAGALNAGTVSATGGDAFLNGASVTASGLVEATNNVSVQSSGAVNLAAITADSDSDLVGDVLIGTTIAPTSIAISGATSGANVRMVAIGNPGSIGAGDITSTVGNVQLDASGAITTGDVSAATFASINSTGGSVTTGNVVTNSPGSSLSLRAGGAASDIKTGTLNSNGGDMLVSAGRNITTGDIATALVGAPTGASIGLHAGGSIKNGQIDAGEDLRAEASGNFTATGITAGDDVLLEIGGLATVGDITTDGDGIDTFAFTFGGPAGASSLLFSNETTPGSDIVINSGSANLGALSAADDITVRAPSAIKIASALANNDSIDGGSLVVRSSGSTVDILGHAEGVTVSLRAAEALKAGTVTATGGDAFLNGASVTATGLVEATDDVSVQSPGAVRLASVAADSDSDISGDVLIGTTIAPSSIAISGVVSGVNVTLLSSGAIGTGDLTAVQGLVVRSSGSSLDVVGHAQGAVVTLRAAGALNAGTVSATGGDAFLNGASVTASGLVKATDDVSVQSAGAVNLAAVTADSDSGLVGDVLIGTTIAPTSIAISGATSGVNVTLQSSGAIGTGDLTAVQDLVVRSSGSSLDVVGHAQGAIVTLRAASALTTDTVTATGGDALLNGASVTASGLVQATNNVSVQSRGSVSLAAVTADSDSDLVGDVLIGTTIAPTSIAISGATSGANVRMIASGTPGSITTGPITSTAGKIDLEATGPISTGN